MMKLALKLVYTTGLILCLGASVVFAAADIPTSQARAKILEAGEKLLDQSNSHAETNKTPLKSPFTAKLVAKEISVAPKSGRPATDAEFLQLLAAKLNPTGTLMLGDQALLLFGEKKVKVGDTIKIPFDKDSVDVELVDLSGTSFTLRLNNEQLTRPIKPGK